MSDGNGKGIIITREQELSEFAAKQRRVRKPTIGEVEDAMNDWAHTLLMQYGPIAAELRTLRLELQTIQRKLGPVVGGEDTE